MSVTSPESAESRTARSSPWFSAALIVAVGLAVYAPSFGVPFFFDDMGAVVKNPTITHLLSFAPWAPPADGSTATGRPLVNFSFALNHSVSGWEVWSYHAVNVAIHVGCALVLCGIVRRTLALPVLEQRFRGSVNRAALAVALIWLAHPLVTETVVCVAQRTESLCALFFLLTLYAFVRSADGDQAKKWQVISVICCLAGMVSKEVMVTAPLLVVLYDRTFVSGTFSAGWRRHRSYYIGLAATWLLLAFVLVMAGGSRGAAAGFGLGVSPWAYLLKQAEALPLYLKLSLWPHPLVVDYGTAVGSSLGEVWLRGFAILAALVAVGWLLWRRPIAGFFGAWFFLILAPSSSVVPLVSQTIAEHRMYLPLCAVVTCGVVLLFSELRRVATLACAAIAIALALTSAARVHDYRDEVTIWSDNVAKQPQVPRAHNNLALALSAQGRNEEATNQFAKAVALDPTYVSARYNWAVMLLAQGQPGSASEQLQEAVRLAPAHRDAWLNLGNARMQQQRVPEAIAAYREAMRLQPAADGYFNLGIAYASNGETAQAIAAFTRALAQDNHLSDAHYRRARLYAENGQTASAEADYAATLALVPGHPGALGDYGLLLAQSGRLEQAAALLQTLVRLKPDDPDAQANLGNILLLQGNPRDAALRYEAALRLRPADARLRQSLELAREAAR